jgi:catechol 2,3-dioxygenase-like lactoylglutathione lyase family enzyme
MKTLFFIICGLITSGLYGQLKLEPIRLGITVKNVEQASHWYEDNLGFKTYKKMDFPDYDGLKIYFLRQGEFEIELIEKRTSFSIKHLRPDYDLNKEPLEGLSKMAFRIDNLGQLFEKLKRNGVKQIMGITHDKEFDIDFFMIEDLDGNILQFIGPGKK